jgi:hypothetical protein
VMLKLFSGFNDADMGSFCCTSLVLHVCASRRKAVRSGGATRRGFVCVVCSGEGRGKLRVIRP